MKTLVGTADRFHAGLLYSSPGCIPTGGLATVGLPWPLNAHQLYLSQHGFDWMELSSMRWETDTAKEDQV